MFKLENGILRVELPEGKTQDELIALCAEEIRNIEADCHGLVCKSVSIYDPKSGISWHII